MKPHAFRWMLLGLFWLPNAEAGIVYEITATCTSRTLYYWTTGELVADLGCPPVLYGQVVMPDAYVPGTLVYWDSRFSDTQFRPLEFTLYGDDWDEWLPGSPAARDWGHILLPAHAGLGIVRSHSDPCSFRAGGSVGDVENRTSWRHDCEYHFSSRIAFRAYGGPMTFLTYYRVPEPGTLALLGLGLAGLGLSRRRKAN